MTNKISIILPTYNRSQFIEQAFTSILGQSYTDWELIIVNDGSTDDTEEIVHKVISNIKQPVTYVYQQNMGAYAARNTGLNYVKNELIAFYDSDDAWEPHHLSDCMKAMDDNPKIDWVYGAARRIIHSTGKVFEPHTFYINNKPRSFFKLSVEKKGMVNIIKDENTLSCHIEHGLYCPLQNSLIKAEIFNKFEFDTTKRNGQDQIMVAKCLAAGYTFAYINDIHTIYYIHASNSSAAGGTKDLDKQFYVISQIISSYEEFLHTHKLNKKDKNALRRRIAKAYFWHLGYNIKWQLTGKEQEKALGYFKQGIKLWPWSFSYWKTFLLCKIKLLFMKIRRGV